MALNNRQKQVLATQLIDVAGNLVEFWFENRMANDELMKGVTSQDISEQLGKWLHRLPGEYWDDRLTVPPRLMSE